MIFNLLVILIKNFLSDYIYLWSLKLKTVFIIRNKYI
jgi:hypothetical protein